MTDGATVVFGSLTVDGFTPELDDFEVVVGAGDEEGAVLIEVVVGFADVVEGFVVVAGDWTEVVRGFVDVADIALELEPTLIAPETS